MACRNLVAHLRSKSIPNPKHRKYFIYKPLRGCEMLLRLISFRGPRKTYEEQPADAPVEFGCHAPAASPAAARWATVFSFRQNPRTPPQDPIFTWVRGARLILCARARWHPPPPQLAQVAHAGSCTLHPQMLQSSVPRECVCTWIHNELIPLPHYPCTPRARLYATLRVQQESRRSWTGVVEKGNKKNALLCPYPHISAQHVVG